MLSSGIWRRVARVRTDESEERGAPIMRVTRIGELGTKLAATSVRRLLVTASVVPSSPILVILMMEALSSSETRLIQEPHGVTYQKTAFFIVTAVKTSNLTKIRRLADTNTRASGIDGMPYAANRAVTPNVSPYGRCVLLCIVSKDMISHSYDGMSRKCIPNTTWAIARDIAVICILCCSRSLCPVNRFICIFPSYWMRYRVVT
jgi:hypothetical protein